MVDRQTTSLQTFSGERELVDLHCTTTPIEVHDRDGSIRQEMDRPPTSQTHFTAQLLFNPKDQHMERVRL